MTAADPVVASFDRAAGRYLRHAGAQEALARWLAEWLPAPRRGRALELGAGPGVFTRLLPPWEGPLVATDASPAMIRAGRAALPRLDWRVMTAERPAEGPWDWIFSSSMLQWSADPAAVLAAWRGRLAPGGRVLTGLFAAGTLGEWESLSGPGPVSWRGRREWRALIEGAGLRLLRDGAEPRALTYPSALALLRSLHRAGTAPGRRLPAPRLRGLLRAYERANAVAGGVGATWVFYRFEAAR